MAKQINCKGCGAAIYKGAKKCPHCGKSTKKPTLFIMIGIIALMILIIAVFSKKKNNPNQNITYKWPASGIAAILPKPESQYGKITLESQDYFSIELYSVSQPAFDNYIDVCMENGFTIDYSKSDSHYYAYDENNNSLHIFFNAADEIMNISIYAADENNEVPNVEDSKPDTEEEADNINSREENSEPENSSGAEGENGNNKLDSDTRIEETDNETKPEIPTDSDKGNVEFRAWVDSYEAFINKYVDFMVSYDAADISMLNDYMNLISEYTEFIEAAEKLSEDDFSVADWAYYTSAQTRILAKLNTIQ